MFALLLIAVLSSHSQCTLQYEGKQVFIVTPSRTASYAYRVRSFVDGKVYPQMWRGIIRPGQRKPAGKKGARGVWTFKVDKCDKV